MAVVLALGAILSLVAGLVMLERAVRSTPFGVGLIVVSFALNAAIARQASVFVGGARVSPTDLVAAVILGAAVARVLRSRLSGLHWVLLAVLTLLFVSLARGALEFGVESAVNDFRSFMRYFGTVLYVSTITPNAALLDRLGRLWIVLALTLLPLLALRWMNRFLGLSIGVLDATYDAPIRVLDGGDSFFYAEALLLVLPATAMISRKDRRWRLLLTGLLVAVNLALNRRTAFAALLLAVGALALRNRRVRRQLGRVALALAAVGLAVALFAPSNDQTVTQAGDEPLGQSATDIGTLQWRIEGWTSLLSDHIERGAADILLGQPMGAGYEREANERTVESNPHNWYLQVFLRSGLAGIAGLLWLYGVAIVRLAPYARRPTAAPPSTFDLSTIWTLLLLEAVWYTAWPPHQLQGVVLGVAIAVVAGTLRTRGVDSAESQPLAFFG